MDDGERHLRARAKVLMRKRFRGQRSSLPLSAIAARSKLLVERLLDEPAMIEATSVALFWPMIPKKEVDLRPVHEALRTRGVTLAYPYIDPETNEMDFRVLEPGVELVATDLGFDAPPQDAPVADKLDVIVVPGLAFDGAGYRIGYGAGYYDGALSRRPESMTIGVAFDFQLATDIPFSERDVAVQRIVTDRQTLVARS